MGGGGRPWSGRGREAHLGGRGAFKGKGETRESAMRLEDVPESGFGQAPHEGGLEATVGPGGGAEGARLGLFLQQPGRPWAKDLSG